MDITGYRTNRDHTQTLAWTVRADGTVICGHDADQCCPDCVAADGRLAVTPRGVEIGHWPANAIREGRKVRFIDLGRG